MTTQRIGTHSDRQKVCLYEASLFLRDNPAFLSLSAMTLPLSGPAETSIPPFLGTVLLSLLLVGSGCDTSIQPTAPSSEHIYSIYGVLDPARDTQWVRVEPTAVPTSEGTPENLDAVVTLENVDTGKTWTLRDSLMEVFRNEVQHNFWTSAPITGGTTYRITVQRSDGASAQAQTTTPAHPPSISFRGGDGSSLTVFMERVDELAAIKVRYFSGFGAVRDLSYYDRAQQIEGRYRAVVTPGRDAQRLGLVSVDSVKVVATAGGPDWPEWDRYHNIALDSLVRPDTFSNVDGGLGRIAGVYSATTPLR